MSERAKPWVGWMMATNPPAPHEHDAIYGSEESARRFIDLGADPARRLAGANDATRARRADE